MLAKEPRGLKKMLKYCAGLVSGKVSPWILVVIKDKKPNEENSEKLFNYCNRMKNATLQ